MLETPFGVVNIYIDKQCIENYTIKELPLTSPCFNVDGRYCITVDFKPDGKKHTIFCKIENYTSSDDDGIESGENLVGMGFYKNGGKLSIGIESDTWYLDGKRYSRYDYDCSYSENGYVAFEILEFTKSEKFIFGIAWKEECDEQDAGTWYASDPTMF